MTKNIEMIKIKNMKKFERLEDGVGIINSFTKTSHIGYDIKNLPFLNLNLNLITQLQRNKL